jgi:folylpolyglutamate synthase
MAIYLHRMGYSPDDFNSLGLIHIAGTKGKGSTACMVEQLLRQGGHTTGLYTSPHLLQVRERIRIQGQPLSQEEFAHYFFQVWDRLEATSVTSNQHMPLRPNYFRFLTCLALHVFSQKRTTATILEVGVGGMFDSTNVISKPVVTAITSLGYDHMNVLGSSIADIARQKAGIMKLGAPCLTVPQVPLAMASLKAFANHEAPSGSGPLLLAPPLPTKTPVGIAGNHQRLNGALALAVAQYFITRSYRTVKVNQKPSAIDTYHSLLGTYLDVADPGATLVSNDSKERNVSCQETQVPMCVPDNALTDKVMLEVLAQVKWPGRSQVLHPPVELTLLKPFIFYVDGAHTQESIAACQDWFRRELKGSGTSKRHLLFAMTHSRNPMDLLRPLVHLHATLPFSSISFCCPVGAAQKENTDTTAIAHPVDATLQTEHSLKRAWTEATAQTSQAMVPEIKVLSSVPEALRELSASLSPNSNVHTKEAVLVTGSLYLVGALFDVFRCEVA